MIEETAIQQSISACTQLLAGLVFDTEVVRQLFRREDMRESVIYQEILQEGREEGRQSELRLVMRLLNRLIGAINVQLQTQIENLSLTQLEDLGEALLDFATEEDLVNWLNNLVWIVIEKELVFDADDLFKHHY
jgi:predicted transposase YdaD